MTSRATATTTVACLLVLGGCAWLPEPATRQAQDIDALWGPYTIVATVVTVLIAVLLLVVIVRDRRRDPDEMPAQVAYNIPIEIAYILVPLLLLGWLGFLALQTQDRVVSLDADPDVVIEVVAYRWQWQFTYRDEDVVLDGADGEPELVLPASSTIEFTGTAQDVIHSFWVPGFLFKQDLIPGQVTTFQVDTLEPGVHAGECAEFCGLDHARMGFTVRTVPPDEYEGWLDDARAATTGGTP